MIKLVNVSKYYSTNNVIALGLRKVNLELHRNEFVAIVGESGSGKTTLLNVISGIDSYEDGEMYVNGKETSYYSVSDMEDYRKSYVAFVFQNYNLIDSYTVLQNVEAPLILSGYPKDKIREKAVQIIKRVGLEDHMNHKATRLSGGQKQRVVIARALAKDCPIIAADEPTGNLDSQSAKQVLELLHEISKEKLVIIVTHDFSQVKEYATRKIRVFDGEIVEDLNLKKVDKLDLPTINTEEHKIKFKDYLGITLRNLLAVPKKSLLMLVIFTFFSFFVAITYGAYQLVVNESNTTVNRVFTYSNPNRLVVRKDDNSVFNDDDITELANLSNVKEVIENDYILDWELAFLYETNTRYITIGGVFLPLSVIDESDLEYGRLPQADNEMVISLPSGELSDYEDYLNLTFTNRLRYENGPELSYKIVGIVNNNVVPQATYQNYDSLFFGTNANYEVLKQYAYLFNIISGNISFTDTDDNNTLIVSDIKNNYFIIDNTVPNNEIRTMGKSLDGCDSQVCTYNAEINITDYYKSYKVENINIVYDRSLTEYGVYYLSQTTYDSIFYDEIYQVSLLTDSEIGVTQLMNTIKRIDTTLLNDKYHVVYPFDSKASQDLDALIMLISSIGMIVLNVVILLGSTLITYVIFRAIINTKLSDYAIFRTIGANKNTIKKFIYIENYYIVVGAYVIYLIVSLSIPFDLVYDTFFYPLKAFSFINYIVYFGLLIIMATIISRRYCNKIFSQTVQSTLKSDLG